MRALALTLNQKDWTQERIADALGVGQQTVSDWLNKNTTNTETGNGCIPKAHAKLSADQKKEIFDRAKAGERQTQLAADFDVSQPAIHKAIKSVEKREDRAARILAKASLPHGEFIPMIEGLPFSERTAQRLMSISENPVISNTTHVSLLPPSWGALYELSKQPDEKLNEAFEAGLAKKSNFFYITQNVVTLR